MLCLIAVVSVVLLGAAVCLYGDGLSLVFEPCSVTYDQSVRCFCLYAIVFVVLLGADLWLDGDGL